MTWSRAFDALLAIVLTMAVLIGLLGMAVLLGGLLWLAQMVWGAL